MSHVTDTELKELGRSAAQLSRGRIETHFVEVKSGEDASGDPAYFFQYEVPQPSDSQTVADVSAKIARLLRDTLIQRGDENFPYVRLM